MKIIPFKRKGLLLLFLLLGFIMLSMGIKNISLNKRAIVIGLGIDSVENRYEVTVQALMTKQTIDSDTKKSTLSVSAEGSSINKAISALDVKTGKILSFALCHVIVIGADVAKNEVMNALDFMINKADTARNCMLLFTNGKAKDCFFANNPIESSGMLLLQDMLRDRHNKTYKTKTIKDFSADYYSKSQASFMPILELKKADNEKIDYQNIYFDIDGIALFKNGKYISKLNKRQTMMLNLLDKTKTKSVFQMELSDGREITFETDKKQVKKVFKLNKIPICDIVTFIGLKVLEITYPNGKVESTNQNERIFLSNTELNTISKILKEEIQDILEKCDLVNLDILHLYDGFYQRFGKKSLNFITTDNHFKVEKKIEVNIKIV